MLSEGLNLNYLILKLTNRCNLNCYMCGQAYSGRKKEDDDLSFNNIKKQLLKIDTLKTVYLFGGEPLLYKEFVPLLELLGKKKVNILLSTNGILLHKFTQDIITNKVRDISISMDSYEADIFEKIRGKGTFKIVTKNLENLIHEREKMHSKYPYIGINFVVLPENFEKMIEFYDFVINHYPEINRVNFEFPMLTTFELGKKHELILKEEFSCNKTSWEWFYNRIPNFSNNDLDMIHSQIMVLNKNPKVSFIGPNSHDEIVNYFTQFNPVSPKMCYFPFRAVSVLPNGDVTFCVDYPDYILGNIHDDLLIKIWNNENSQKVRDYLKKNRSFPICARCPRQFLDDDFLMES